MKFDVCVKCLLLIGCYHVSGAGTEDILTSDRKHRTHKAAEKAHELHCYKCHSMDYNQSYCWNVTSNETSLHQKCDGDMKTCMVKKIYYTTTANSSAASGKPKMWSLERNCTQKCEAGCIIIGERLKLHKCTSCCEGKNFCNSGNGASVIIITPFLLLLSVSLLKINVLYKNSTKSFRRADQNSYMLNML